MSEDAIPNLTPEEFITDIRKRMDHLYPKIGHLADLKSDTDDGTITKVECFAFMVIIKGLLDNVKVAAHLMTCVRPECQTTAGCKCAPLPKASLSDFTDEEIAREYFWRAQQKLGDPRVWVNMSPMEYGS
jgi:hypothetical protein